MGLHYCGVSVNYIYCILIPRKCLQYYGMAVHVPVTLVYLLKIYLFNLKLRCIEDLRLEFFSFKSFGILVN